MFLFLWDGFAWIFIILPFIVGGIWFRGRHGLMDLPGCIPILILGGITWIIQGTHLQTKLLQTSSIRFLFNLWNFWKRHLTTHPKRTMGCATLSLGACWSMTALVRHWSLNSHAYDLGIFVNALWNASHGYGLFCSHLRNGINLLLEHHFFLFWTYAPLYYFFPYPETLFILQALTLAAGMPIVYLLSRQFLEKSHWANFALPLLYACYPAIRHANNFDFHPETLMLPMALTAIVGLQSTQKRGRWIGACALLLMLSIKESAGPLLFCLGLSWFFGAGPSRTQSFTRRIGLPISFLGIMMFLLQTQIVVPIFLKTTYVFHDLYSQFGTGLSSLLLAPFLKPGLFFSTLFAFDRIRFLIYTLLPLAFVPIFNLKAFLTTLAPYAMLFLTNGNHRLALGFYYGIEPAIGLFFAFPAGILYLEKKFNTFKKIPLRLSTLLFLCALLCHHRSDIAQIRLFWPSPQAQWLRNEVFPQINSHLPLIGPGSWLPHLAHRHWIHDLHEQYHTQGYLQQDYTPARCAIIDQNREQIDPHQVISLGFELIWSCQGIYIFEKPNLGTEKCLNHFPKCVNF